MSQKEKQRCEYFLLRVRKSAEKNKKPCCRNTVHEVVTWITTSDLTESHTTMFVLSQRSCVKSYFLSNNCIDTKKVTSCKYLFSWFHKIILLHNSHMRFVHDSLVWIQINKHLSLVLYWFAAGSGLCWVPGGLCWLSRHSASSVGPCSEDRPSPLLGAAGLHASTERL